MGQKNLEKNNKIGIVILAGGVGSRMKLDIPKPLVPLLGRPLLSYPINTSLSFLKNEGIPGKVSVVIGYQGELIRESILRNFDNIDFVIQPNPSGTADALKCYLIGNEENKQFEYTVVICGDTPLITKSELSEIYRAMLETGSEAVVGTFVHEFPQGCGYGRVIRDGVGIKIKEEREATSDEKKINEMNSGLYIFQTKFLINSISKIKNRNNTKEYYLTDIFNSESKISPITFKDGKVFRGVNDLIQLEEAEKWLGERKRLELGNKGVRFKRADSNIIDDGIEIGAGSIVGPNAIIEGETIIGKNCLIGPGAIIRSCKIGDNVKILAYSHLEDSIIEEGADVGPFARIRPEANIGKNVKIGNFVEIKKSDIHQGAKVSHLSYVGDSEIGENSNLGCGFISCNYDGKNKHKTVIGKNSFIGSDTQTVAPVKIGDNCFIASGSTINKDVPDDSFAISRGRQVTMEGKAKRFMP
jgi:bifunctional UDP-N-acetylglucosamine pyrophosphorylase / glucosamine-1-phosphate N-acetyltransferase